MIPTSTVATTEMRNPLSLDMYILAYNSSKQLINATNNLKNNLSTYINEYKIATDAINIKDAFYINIGINFDITTAVGFNNNEVISNCILSLKDYFDINKWQINQPILLKDLYILLDKIEGVQTVKNVKIENKAGENLGYSKYGYDIAGATFNNVVYPSLDPSIFEIKYLNEDINGRVVGL